MKILTIRTDKPEAEIGLFEDSKKLSYKTWPAHRQLAETLHTQIEQLLSTHNLSMQKEGLEGLVCFRGPGSFTGLRIGLTVANTLAYSLNIPIVGGMGDNWIDEGIRELKEGKNEQVVMPEYGSEPHITKPRK
ncbi:MAG TPA: tRNA (adenosine(37)-N6)-threonylcarbamoyltransferase complex dimerization subunit type 1 TsaB [Patescibacteria group bacterium]|nr:tRNA (adenosine(37)-N6)-threonylcarbamoyltransferase complex dimerization subunit type 1 TsaB [Patescibacteria group bacterium]